MIKFHQILFTVPSFCVVLSHGSLVVGSFDAWFVVCLNSHLVIKLSNSRWCVVSLTHWGRVTHMCVGKSTIIASDNGLSPGRRQAIIWTNAGILLIGPLGTKFNEIFIEIHTFSSKKMHLKMSSAKWRPFCLGPNMLIVRHCDGTELNLPRRQCQYGPVTMIVPAFGHQVRCIPWVQMGTFKKWSAFYAD